MRRSLIAFLCLAAAACGGDATPTAVTAGADVFTPGNTFSPFSTVIPVGGTVRFNISGDSHNVIFAKTPAGAPSDVNVVTNVVSPRTFTTAGTFTYTCTVHPGMSGQVVVQ